MSSAFVHMLVVTVKATVLQLEVFIDLMTACPYAACCSHCAMLGLRFASDSSEQRSCICVGFDSEGKTMVLQLDILLSQSAASCQHVEIAASMRRLLPLCGAKHSPATAVSSAVASVLALTLEARPKCCSFRSARPNRCLLIAPSQCCMALLV